MTTTENELPPAEERMADFPEPPTKGVEEVKRWNRLLAIYLVITAVALSLSVLVGAIAIGWQQEADARAARNATAAAEAKTEAQAATAQGHAAVKGIEEANRRLAALGKPTVPVPTISSPSPVPVSEGLSAQQTAAVQVIVANELARYQPSITPAQTQQIARVTAAMVPKPKDGRTPTAAELQPLIMQAVAVTCGPSKCEGKPGASVTGPTGPAGKDAPPVTDEQLRPLIAQAFTAYCTQESRPCDGKDGVDGSPGASGPPGTPGRDAPPPYSVVDQDCEGDDVDSYWVIYLSNGADQRTISAKGPCRVGPEPIDPPPSQLVRKTR